MDFPKQERARHPQFHFLIGLFFIAMGVFMGFEFFAAFVFIGFGFANAIFGIGLYFVRAARADKQPAIDAVSLDDPRRPIIESASIGEQIA